MNKKIKKEKKKKNLGRKKMNLDGMTMKPKLKAHQNLISVSEIIVIAPSLKKGVIKKSLKLSFRRLFKLVMDTLESADTSEGDILLALDEVAKTKKILQDKSRQELDQQEYHLMWHKVTLLERKLKEKRAWLIKMQKNYAMFLESEFKEKKGRGR